MAPKAYPRQVLTKIITTTLDSIIQKQDSKYGKQLATQLEAYANELRLHFGGRKFGERPSRIPKKTAVEYRAPSVQALNIIQEYRCPECAFQRKYSAAGLKEPCPKCKIPLEVIE